jgi:broad specificity phosphatase PhoE
MNTLLQFNPFNTNLSSILSRFFSLKLTLRVYIGTAITFSMLLSTVRTLRFIRKRFLRSNRPQRILLLRHGESVGNMDVKAYQRVPDPQIPLSKKGVLQAKELGIRIKEKIGQSKCLVYVSPYLRAKQTAEIALRALNRDQILCWVEDPRLREQEFCGSFQHPDNMPYEERLRYSKFFFRFPNGESAADVYDRITMFLDSLHRDFTKHTSRDDVVLIFSHGLTNRLFIMRWLHYEVATFEKTRNPPNASMLELVRKRHVPPQQGETYMITEESLRILFSDDLLKNYTGGDKVERLRVPLRRRRGSSWQEQDTPSWVEDDGQQQQQQQQQQLSPLQLSQTQAQQQSSGSNNSSTVCIVGES